VLSGVEMGLLCNYIKCGIFTTKTIKPEKGIKDVS